MCWHKELRMKIGYKLMGNLIANLTSGPFYQFLKDNVPLEFLGRNVSDLGCGDGFSSLKIKEILRAKSIKGFEINDDLIKRARKRGLTVEKLNLEKEMPKGEMATIWGVLHHLKDKENFLKKIQSNFKYAVFNEPIKNIWSFLDGGEPLTEKEWRNIFSKILGDCKFLRFKDNLFIFWHA